MLDQGIIQPGLKSLEVGETFTGFYLLREKLMGVKRDGANYLTLDICDQTGRLKAKLWTDADRINEELIPGEVIKIHGAVTRYNEKNEVNIQQIRPTNERDEIDWEKLIPVSSVDPQTVLDQFEKMASRFKNEKLKELVLAVFQDEKIKPVLLRAPGGKMWHHARLGGLLEHTRGVVNVCRILARLYPQVDRELLLSGAMLHDIGKIYEYTSKTIFDYTDKGRLVGHIVIGAQMVTEKAHAIDDFPEDVLDRLLHLVLSHQGEYDTPKKPSIPEAFLLYWADEIDSKMDALKILKNNLAEGETWKYNNLLKQWIDVSQLDIKEE